MMVGRKEGGRSLLPGRSHWGTRRPQWSLQGPRQSIFVTTCQILAVSHYFLWTALRPSVSHRIRSGSNNGPPQALLIARQWVPAAHQGREATSSHSKMLLLARSHLIHSIRLLLLSTICTYFLAFCYLKPFCISYYFFLTPPQRWLRAPYRAYTNPTPYVRVTDSSSWPFIGSSNLSKSMCTSQCTTSAVLY